MPGSAAFSILIGVKDLASNRLRTVAREVGKIGDAADAAGKRIKPLQDKLKKLEKTGESMRKAFLPGAAIAAGLGGTVAAFATVEEAQNRLKTNLMDVTGKVGPEYEQLLALADRLGTELPGSTMDMIEMFTALREQGVQTNVILGGMGEAAAKFSVIMKVPFAEAATHVAKFSEAMGIADKDAVAFMDQLQRLKSAGGVNVTDLAETFKYSGASLKALRLQGMQAGKDVSAAIGMMATSSIEGSQAGTNFSMALSRMAEISHKLETKKIKEMVGPILDAKGIKLDFFDQGGNFVGIRGMIKEMEKLRAVNPQEQLFVLSKLFGQEAARPLSVFINQSVAGFDEMNRRMQQQAECRPRSTPSWPGPRCGGRPSPAPWPT
ncbi:MAG: phage tail tape measure protein [Desulfobulbus sp.]